MNPVQKWLINVLGGYTPDQRSDAVEEAVKATRVMLNLSGIPVDKLVQNVKDHMAKAENLRDAAAAEAEEARRVAARKQNLSDKAGDAARETESVIRTIGTMPLEGVDTALDLPVEEEDES